MNRTLQVVEIRLQADTKRRLIDTFCFELENKISARLVRPTNAIYYY